MKGKRKVQKKEKKKRKREQYEARMESIQSFPIPVDPRKAVLRTSE